MKDTSISILILHGVLFVLLLLFQRMFPRVRFAVFGVYFVLMPIGFSFFMETEPWTTSILALGGLFYILTMADRAVKKAQDGEEERGLEA